MLFENACLSPSAPLYRRRNRDRVAQQQPSVRHSDQFIPSPKSTLILPFAISCSPKRKRFAPRRSYRAPPWRMILCSAASSRCGPPTKLNVYPKRMQFGNANAVKTCEIESRSFAVRPFSSILITASPARTLIAAPQHRDGGRQTPAHVEGKITFRVWNLSLAGLLAQMLIGFEDLTHTRRADRMAVAD